MSSSRREILLSRDTLLGLVAVLVLAAVCVTLGLWQFGRYEGRVDQAAVIRANYEAAPVSLDQAMPDVGAPLPAADEWTPVTLHGSYCATDDCVLYVRNRQLSGRVGFWQLVPFRTEDSSTMLVVRGWVPSGSDTSQPADPAPVPDGEITLTVRLRPAEEVLDREPPPGQTHSVNPRQSVGLMGLDASDLVTGAYGELITEEPAADRPAALASPDTSLGPHLSYAFQWWIFALFFPAALVYRTRRQFQDVTAEEQQRATERTAPDGAPEPDPDQDGSVPTTRPAGHSTDHRPRRTVRARRRGQDEEEEDALIDQQRP
ncbi:MAG: SURF1 family protein [Brachybacterium sp.]|nr:SURF1 family protein [Brachybacterium sp.]